MKTVKVRSHKALIYEVEKVRIANKLYEAGFKNLAYGVENREMPLTELAKLEKSVDKYNISKV